MLTDFRTRFRSLFVKAEIFAALLADRSIEMIDLYPLLRESEGNYLNFDGHWSPFGNQRVADYLESKLVEESD